MGLCCVCAAQLRRCTAMAACRAVFALSLCGCVDVLLGGGMCRMWIEYVCTACTVAVVACRRRERRGVRGC